MGRHHRRQKKITVTTTWAVVHLSYETGRAIWMRRSWLLAFGRLCGSLAFLALLGAWIT